jgi:branched-chain amino acid transport system ATP-binding protein
MLNNNEILRVEDLSIAFGGLKAVDDLSFHVNEKEIYGLIGPNGAGKTTVFNCITQFYKPDTGHVLFRTAQGNEVDLTTVKTHNIIPLGLVRTFQNVELIGDLSILDNLLVGAHTTYKSGFLANALRFPSARREELAAREKAHNILRFLKIDDKAHEPAHGQPYGVLKKAELGRTLMSDPELIILDEPAAGLNDTETAELADLIKEIRDTYHCTVLLVEHDMRLVMGICDRICAINFGKKLVEGTPAQVQGNKDVQEAYLGSSD